MGTKPLLTRFIKTVMIRDKKRARRNTSLECKSFICSRKPRLFYSLGCSVDHLWTLRGNTRHTHTHAYIQESRIPNFLLLPGLEGHNSSRTYFPLSEQQLQRVRRQTHFVSTGFQSGTSRLCSKTVTITTTDRC